MRSGSGQDTNHALDRFMMSAASVLGLDIKLEWRDGVLTHLETLVAASALVEGYRLADDVEPAVLFQA